MVCWLDGTTLVLSRGNQTYINHILFLYWMCNVNLHALIGVFFFSFKNNTNIKVDNEEEVNHKKRKKKKEKKEKKEKTEKKEKKEKREKKEKKEKKE